MNEKYKIVIILTVSMVVAVGFYLLSIHVIKDSASTDDAKLTSTFDYYEHQKEYDAISNIDDRSFQWAGRIGNEHMDLLRTTFKKYLKSDTDNLLEIYPDKAFFRLLRYACFYDDLEITDKHIPRIIEIIRSHLTYDHEYYYQVEYTDAMMLLVARYDIVFKNLPNDLKELIMSLSFADFVEYNGYSLNFRESIKNNYYKEVIPFVFEVLHRNRRDILDKHSKSIVYRMLNYLFDNYDDEYFESFINLYDFACITYKARVVEDYYFYIKNSMESKFNLMRTNNKVFRHFFNSKPNWRMYKLTFGEYKYTKKEYIDPDTVRNVLNWESFCLLFDLWDKVKDDESKSDQWRRILNYIPPICSFIKDSYGIYHPTPTMIEGINQIEDLSELKKEVEIAITEILTDCFIVYKTGYMYNDRWIKDRFISYDIHQNRLIYKWRYGEPGYGSPTFPTGSFIDWDLHKSEFPKYATRRKQYLDFMEKHKDFKFRFRRID